MKVGEILKSLRKRTGLTQMEFSKIVGIERNRISRYENEVDRISLEMLLSWCEKLNINPKDVFDI